MIAEERATVINTTDADDLVKIWTAQRRFITQLRKHPKVTEIRSGYVDSSEWAEFSIPADQWSPVTGVKRASGMTAEQKRIASDRMAQLRSEQLAAQKRTQEIHSQTEVVGVGNDAK